MAESSPAEKRYRMAFVLILAVGVGLAFVTLTRNFLLAVLLAAVFSALLHPLYLRARRMFRSGPAVTSAIVIFFLLIAVGVPVFAFAGIVAAEALSVSKAVEPWLRERIYDTGAPAFQLPEWLPFSSQLEPFKSQILEKLGELIGSLGQFLFSSLRDATSGAVGVLLNLFVFLYAMFFFLMRGSELLDSVLRYLPLTSSDRERLIERGLAVSRAILRSILIIGLLQGVLVGAAFWVLGINGAFFWGAIVLILSSIPGLGSVIVWAPGAVYLFAIGQHFEGIALIVWGAFVVGLVDNVLRPRIVGGETKIPDLFILLAVLGGIGAFGVVGIIVGPIIAAVFLTALDIYQNVFSGLLPGKQAAKVDLSEPSKPSS